MRILFVVHNHPALQPGGTEAFALALFRHLREHHGAAGMFIAGVTRALRPQKPGTLVQAAGPRDDELLVSLDHFDRFFLSQHDIYGLSTVAQLVTRLRPEVVHVQHPLLFGLEGIDMLRRAAPRARLVATLHDYFALCPQEGQLLTPSGVRCGGPTLSSCGRCFPDRSTIDLAIRDISIRDAFRAFDTLISPSRFLRDRFIAAGWDASRLVVLPHGIPDEPPATHRPAPDGRRDRFAVFGNINRFKGTLVALQASARLSAQGVAHGLAVHGGTAWQGEEFIAAFDAALAAAPSARHHGPYVAEEQSARMAAADWVVVPSIWYENAPLVILEAFRHRRPVICSGIGGMAELVTDGTDGLHAPVNDPEGLAATLGRAAEETGLWERLVAGIRPPAALAECARRHLALYRGEHGARAA